jgi:Ca2+-dependent lipid-binding protein
MHFWNKKLPLLLSKSQRLVANTNTDIRTNYFVQETNSWVLISICIVLAALAISFLVGYCRTRRQLIQILTQNGVPKPFALCFNKFSIVVVKTLVLEL